VFNKPKSKKIITGQSAPDFTLPDLEGNLVSLSSFRPCLVIINFWSAECPWSERVDILLSALCDEQRDKVAWCTIASNAHETLVEIKSTASERHLPIILLDAEQKVADQYGAITTPHCYLVDGKGYLVYQGAFDDVTFRQQTPTQFYLHQAVEALVAGEQPKISETPPYGCTIVHNHKMDH
jgi:peroxiredoxin